MIKTFNLTTEIVIADNPANIDKDLLNDWLKRLFNDWVMSDSIINSFTISHEIKSDSDTDTIILNGCISSSEEDIEYVVRTIRKNVISITKELCEKFLESIVYKTSKLEVTY